MKSKVNRWGTSLAIRIPARLANELGLDVGSEMDIVAEGGQLVLKPMRIRPSLSELLQDWPDAARHEAVDWGAPEGREWE